MKFLHIFKLSKGIFRLYAVMAFIMFFVVLYFAWGDVIKAKKFRQNLATGVQILAISKGYILLSGDRQKFVKTPPTHVPVTSGFATYICLFKAGLPQPAVDRDKKVYLNVNISEFYSKTKDSKEYIDCKRTLYKDADNAVILSIIKAFTYALLAIGCLYLLFLVLLHITKWIIRGFK